MNLNKVTLIGFVGRDPEIKYTQSGTAVAVFSLATTEKWKDKQGEKHEKTSWHNIRFFGSLAETIGRYVNKGRQLYIEGKIDYYEYEKDGVKKYGSQILGSTFLFLSSGDTSRQGDNSQQPGGFQSFNPNSQQPQQPGYNVGDDIPF